MKRETILGRGTLRALAAIGLAGALLLSGCGKTASTDTGAAPEKTERQAANEITVGIAQDLDESLDPHYSVAAGTREVMFNVFEGLLKPSPDGQLLPAVAAELPEVSEDGREYTFKVRQGVKFHNGQEVTADDVVWSLTRCWKPEDSEDPLVAGLAAVENIEKVDDATVKVTLTAPNNEFLSCTTLVAILPKDYADQATKPVGTGPYKFISRVAQDNVVIERFEDYWGEPANIGKVTFKIMEKAESLVLGLQSGALDLVMHLSSTQTSQLNADDFNIEQDSMKLVQAVYLNNKVAPLDDVNVRRALCYAVDKQEVIDLAFDGFGSPLGSSMFPSFGKYFDESLTDYYSYDPDKAKQLLKDAGYPNGFDFVITVPSNYQPHVDAATVVAEQLKKVGINATLKQVEWGTWLDDVYKGRNFQATVIGLESKDMTARALLERFYSDKSGNFINYNNSDYDALYEKAIACSDDAEQTDLYKQMLKNLTENAANIYLQDLADLVAVRKGLNGLEFYPMYVLDVAKLAWEQ